MKGKLGKSNVMRMIAQLVLGTAMLVLNVLGTTAQTVGMGKYPVFKNVDWKYTVKENSANGTVVGTFTVMDNDVAASGGFEVLTYTIQGTISGGATTAKDVSELVELAEDVGDDGLRTVSIKVKSKELLDFEQL